MVLLSFASPELSATAPDYFSPEYQPIFEQLTVDDGLPENSVRAMIQDRHGFIWLGTQNGLVRGPGANSAAGFER
ncbi:hypothetical protein H8E52_06530 [bacterium]|nr:hypothetical protein [bacterium]